MTSHQYTTNSFNMFIIKILNIFLFISFINYLKFSSIKAELQVCNKITIEGGELALMKIFNDFAEMKRMISNLTSSYEECQDNKKSKTKDLPFFDIRYDKMPKKCDQTNLPKDCASATACTKRSGIYKIQIPQYSLEPFPVACDMETENGDWLVIQRRQDGSVDFYRNWEEYENGFGDIDGEFFIGLKKLHALTNYNGPQELMILLEDVKSTKVYAKYDAFAIANANDSYRLKKLGKYSGTAGDSFIHHVGMQFTTKDRDHDKKLDVNCAILYTGAWWYKFCHRSNLNGMYGDNTVGKGINWFAFRGDKESLAYTKMMIRRSRIV